MPGLIQILDEQVISQISAGEVIEGPFALVKELVENSLDAGTSSITVAVEAGGKNLVRVTDDGIGMSEDDLKLAFQRYSTSKIRTAQDLQSIATLGFRGEALAAIASVARVEAMSRTGENPSGRRLVIEGGKTLGFEPAGCAEGTTIAVRDLFFNTPARKKFLKSDSREADKCFSIFRALALSRPQIEWRYFQDDRLKQHLPPANLKERIADLLGKYLLDGLLEVDFQSDRYRIEGFICDKAHTRRSREYQFLFLNGRRINDRKLGYFVQNAYEGMARPEEFPLYFLFLEIAPEEMDVNVHPTKTEVRFRQEYEVCSFARLAVQEALGVKSLVPAGESHPGAQSYRFTYPGKQMTITAEDYGTLFQPLETDAQMGRMVKFSPEGEEAEGSFIPRALFQVEGRYIVTQIKSGLAVFDQHAAHERILFEQALKGLDMKEIPSSQKLLFPRLIELAPAEEGSFQELLPQLERMGFEIKPFGERTYLVESAPAGLRISDEITLIRDMLDYYRETEERWADASERAAAAFACKAAIKAGEALSPEEMVGLIEALFRTGTPFACPHGRPTFVTIKAGELDRKFGR